MNRTFLKGGLIVLLLLSRAVALSPIGMNVELEPTEVVTFLWTPNSLSSCSFLWF